MNRAVVWIGVATVLAGFALAAFPIAVTGHEAFDLEQEAGTLVAPVGLVVVMLAFTLHDPRETTVRGLFDADPRRPSSAHGPPAAPGRYGPSEADECRFCRTPIAWDLAGCPRCARARPCRGCGRPLGRVLDRPTCPTCGRPESTCACPRLAPRGAAPAPRAVRLRGD
ncbi:MAG TPA: hypothetical protein VMG36_00565 [Thermoplasmata archaeon]|nr:hypothetical protein [Thermoplasmata archaeon]